MKIKFSILALAAIAALSTGCDAPPAAAVMPEVNDENCLDSNISKITDKATQQEFAGLCARRGEFKRSNAKQW